MGSEYANLPADQRRDLTEKLIAARGSDLGRWARHENLKHNWSLRAEVAARLIPPGSRVLDLGCGAMDLERFLDSSVEYIPADIVARDERTLLCDLNAGVIPQVEADVITLLGVFEYIHDLRRLLQELSTRGATVIASYNPIDLGKPDRDRRSQGWFNDYTSAGLCALATQAGFELIGMATIEPQRIYEFRAA